MNIWLTLTKQYPVDGLMIIMLSIYLFKDFVKDLKKGLDVESKLDKLFQFSFAFIDLFLFGTCISIFFK